MIKTDEDSLLMIEPPACSRTFQINDEITAEVARLLAAATHRGRYRGVHHCSCGEASDNRDWYVVTADGRTRMTNSLALHYVRDHRGDVPPAELRKLGAIGAIATPAPTAVTIPAHGPFAERIVWRNSLGELCLSEQDARDRETYRPLAAPSGICTYAQMHDYYAYIAKSDDAARLDALDAVLMAIEIAINRGDGLVTHPSWIQANDYAARDASLWLR